MSGLADRARGVHGALIDRRRSELSKNVAIRLATTEEQLRVAQDRLSASRAAAAALTSEGLTGLELRKKAVAAVAEGRKKARTVATTLERSERTESEIVSDLEGKQLSASLDASKVVAIEMAAAVQRSLQSEKNELLPPDIERDVPEVPGHPRLAHALNRNRSILLEEIEVSESALQDLERIETFRKKRRTARQAWDRDIAVLDDVLTKEHPEVRSFLEAASSEDGAPLSAVSPAVLERLAADRVLDDFRVRSS